MDSEKAYLRLLLNDIHVDLGMFLTAAENSNKTQDNSDSFTSVQLSDFKERVSNLDNANKKYQIDPVKDDIEKFVNKARENIITNDSSIANKAEIKLLQEDATTLMSKLS